MNTVIYNDDYLLAAELLEKGGLVAVPTETVYGLAGNGLDRGIIEKIYEVKGRPAYKPISLMVSDVSDIDRYTINAPEQAYHLAKRFWPGPLTIVLPAADFLPGNLLAGGTTVGLRCPASLKTLALLKSIPFPLAVPSANISGEPSPKNASEVLYGLEGKIEGVIDGGQCDLGFESTIIDMSRTPYRILRNGSLPAEEIYSVLEERMEIVGITGCSGAGKTTALHILEGEGFSVIDCDRLYHHLLDTDAELLNQIFLAFPGTQDGDKLNRKKLAQIVFQNSSKLDLLNKITHKHICNAIADTIRNAAINGESRVAIDAVELFSSGLNNICKYTIAVLADKDIRVKRLLIRDSLTEKEALMRVNAQKDESYYIRSADYAVYNNSDESQLRDIICRILQKEKRA